MLLGLLPIFSFFVAIDVNVATVTQQNDISPCVHGIWENETMYERNFPTMDTEAGVAEYVFGTSLGRMRSEELVDVTEAIYPPSIIAVVNDGDTIVGKGNLIHSKL
jgi:hypothetical protein